MIEIPLDMILEKFFGHTRVIDIPMLKKARIKIEKAYKDYSCFPMITMKDVVEVTERRASEINLKVNRDYSDLLIRTSEHAYVSGSLMRIYEDDKPSTNKKIEKIWQKLDFSGIKPERSYHISRV